MSKYYAYYGSQGDKILSSLSRIELQSISLAGIPFEPEDDEFEFDEEAIAEEFEEDIFNL